ncbi:ABC transporter permease [Corynebacterium sp. TAE3-ERU30]|uniref:ABC transporter permease n=1 Tax=Corynebacterium sp. TAE3-ERU30 TaxID=2849496 RepID=UPI001C459A99|nr:ABC transporter permease [Corynebacterium sp. TAE3-ERU30]
MTTITAQHPTADSAAAPSQSSSTADVARVVARGASTLSTALAGIFLLLMISWAALPGIFAQADPLAVTPQSLQPPSAEHWFGTDATGRDVYARVVYGARHSLAGALIAVLVGVIVGTAIGVLAGARGGWVETVLMRVVDVLLAIPALLLSLSIIIIVGFGTINASIAVGVTTVAMFARLARSQVLSVMQADYVEAAFGAGANFPRVLLRHVLPNSLTPVIALAALQFGSAILQISTLGFLGYGATPPTPEWGLLVADGRDYVVTAWWLTVLPGLIVVFTVLAVTRLSRLVHRKVAI